MIIEPMLGKVLRILFALVLVGILAFLYVMSQGTDLRRQAQIGSDLRGLKEVDTAWNRNIAAARSDPFSTESPVERPAARLASILENLATETTPLMDRSLDLGVTGLRNAFVEKQSLVARFEQANDQLRNTLKGLAQSVNGLRQTASQRAATDGKLRPKLAGL
ncbi:MAG: DAHL domain-containing protein, partial [Betaproteobacteria bacterium]